MEEQESPMSEEEAKLWLSERRDAVKYDTKQKKATTKKQIIPKKGIIYLEP